MSHIPARFLVACMVAQLIAASAGAPPPTAQAATPSVMPAATVQSTGPLVFPPDFMTSIKDYGAKGDGVTDDTAAIQRALDDERVDANGSPLYSPPDAYNGRPKALYFPAGVYLVSKTVSWVGCCMSIQGQGSDFTIFKLKDAAPGFGDPAKPLPVIKTEGGNMSFRQNVRDMTIDTGKNNPGAIGIDYISNNSGTLRDMVIRSGDGKGAIGLDLRRAWPGPCLIKNVRIEGFDYGIRMISGEYGPTFERITLLNQHVAGIDNVYGMVTVRGLSSVNSVPVIRSTHAAGLLAIIDGNFQGGAADTSAIESESPMYLRNITSSGYQSAVAYWGAIVPGAAQAEYFTDRYTLFDSPARSLNLPIRETPEYRDDDLSHWGAFKPTYYGDTNGLQELLDSGKSTIYFPFGVYFAYNERVVNVPASVKRIVLFSSVINSDAKGTNGGGLRFVVNESSADPLIIEGVGYGVKIDHRAARTLVVKHSYLSSYTDGPGAGDLFLEDVQLQPATFNYVKNVWARQLNAEGDMSKVNNNSANLWILGLKTELKNTLIRTTSGAKTELLGAALLPLGANTGDPTIPAFIIDNASASLVFRRLVYDGSVDFDTQISEKRGTETRRFASDALPGNVALFTGYQASNATNAAPTVSITEPTPAASLAPGVAVAVRADAADSDGNITKVEFFAGATKIGEDVIAPYCLAWRPLVGDSSLTARATDDRGGTANAAPVAVRVVAPQATGTPRAYLPLSIGGNGSSTDVCGG